MEKEKVRLISLKKLFFNIFITTIFLFTFFFCQSSFNLFNFNLLEFRKEFFLSLSLTFCFDQETFLFLLIVFVVTSLVISYREFYIEHYNLKKYISLTLFFFLSILFLCSRGSFINFLIGWDGLGISSLCLIIFYPNKRTIFNSYLTFFFNRLGDVCILFSFGYIFMEGSGFLFFLFSHYNLFILVLILICAFTKGAQFPLSSWLPAAMSAPTPISAIVHSSTLVTAGIFLM